MPSLNKVFLMGNLTRDPELRYTPGGSAVCEMGIAVNRRYTLANGEAKDEVNFIDIVVWGKQGESAQRFLQKGAGVFVEGRLMYESWTEKDTQKKRSRIRVVAERLQFLGRREEAPQGAAAAGAYNEEGSQEPGHQYAPPPQAPRPAAAPRAPYQPRQGYQQRAPQGAPQQPGAPAPAAGHAPSAQNPPGVKDDPFEVVEGVDDDIPF